MNQSEYDEYRGKSSFLDWAYAATEFLFTLQWIRRSPMTHANYDDQHGEGFWDRAYAIFICISALGGAIYFVHLTWSLL